MERCPSYASIYKTDFSQQDWNQQHCALKGNILHDRESYIISPHASVFLHRLKWTHLRLLTKRVYARWTYSSQGDSDKDTHILGSAYLNSSFRLLFRSPSLGSTFGLIGLLNPAFEIQQCGNFMCISSFYIHW